MRVLVLLVLQLLLQLLLQLVLQLLQLLLLLLLLLLLRRLLLLYRSIVRSLCIIEPARVLFVAPATIPTDYARLLHANGAMPACAGEAYAIILSGRAGQSDAWIYISPRG